MTHRIDIELRFSEMRNTSYADYAEQARVAFFKHLGIPETDLRLARIALDFKKFTRYLDSVYVKTSVEQLGRTSITLKHLIFSNDLVGALGNTVVVYVNQQEEPQALSKDMRKKLEPYLT
jgi:acyl-CoA thioesterase FadM